MTRTSADLFPLPAPNARLRPRSTGGVHLNVEIHTHTHTHTHTPTPTPAPTPTPTIVLIHGWTCSIPFWAPVINTLRHDLRIIAYDQRGHGASDTPGPGHYSVQALVDDLTTVLDAALPPGQKAVLVGHSMGGMTIMAAALRPSILARIQGVLLASTGITELAAAARIFPFAARSPKWGARATRWLLTSKLPLGPVTPVGRSVLKYATLGSQTSKQLATYNAAIVHACHPRPRAAWGHVLDHVELADAVRELDVPTSVLVGTADRLTPPAQARLIAAALPQCEGLTELPGIGHMTPLEAPDAITTLIRDLAAPTITATSDTQAAP
jgi:pimeloyl-ACP methyl ester carboxylesterase